MTPEEFAQIFSDVTGLSAHYVTLPVGQPDTLLPEGLKEELDDNWAMFNEFGYEIRDDPDMIHPSQVLPTACSMVETFTDIVTAGSKPKAGYRSRLDPKARLEFCYELVKRTLSKDTTRNSSHSFRCWL